MFTSLRSRLWLSYALVIAVALTIVSLVLLIFLLRNPLLTRQVQQQLKSAQTLLVGNPAFYEDPVRLGQFASDQSARVLIFDSNRRLLFDSNSTDAQLPFPRRNVFNRNSQSALDASGKIWLYSTSRLTDGRVLVVAAPRPKAPVLSIFTDQFLLPVVQGGVISLLLSLILAFALSRWVADPLQQVIVAARSYPNDSLDTNQIKPDGPHEVQVLTRAFNSMIRRVQNSQQSQRDFVANVSHEMKTPLTSIQGFAQALIDDTANSPESRKRAAQIIYDESARMHRMVLDLLELARLDAGTADLKMSAVDLNALLLNVIDKFTPLANKANVILQLKIEGSLVPIVADGDRLAQVFTNLVDNALKFTPANGSVVLGAKNVGAEIEAWVEDSGIGVGSEALPHLFDRFYQADSSRAGGEKHGAGLGLAIVKEIVEAHGGKIGVRSQLGKGTIFTVRLPRASK